jgi:hypothetical protein
MIKKSIILTAATAFFLTIGVNAQSTATPANSNKKEEKTATTKLAEAGKTSATTATSPAKSERAPGTVKQMDPAQKATSMVNGLTKRLELTAEQQEKAIAIYTTANQKLEGLKSNAEVKPENRRAAQIEIFTERDKQFESILTETQLKKFKERPTPSRGGPKPHDPNNKSVKPQPQPQANPAKDQK